MRLVLLSAISIGTAGCGAIASEDVFDRPVPRIGRGPGYELAPAGKAAAAGRRISGLACTGARRKRYGAHLEVFANGLDVVIPAGIGIRAPRERDGAYVSGGRCQYPARTFEPTGLIEIDADRRITLGQFFDLWGQPLGRRALLGFRAKRAQAVSAFVDGRRQAGDPRAIPLSRHAAVVVELGGYFPPSRSYLFPDGL